jgi:dTDP-4-dehydrorhamnose reductase
VRAAVADFRPQAIVNAAAYTAVDKAESEPERAGRINAQGPQALADAAVAADCRLIHVSTDFVFDGRGSTPYRTDAGTAPLSVYGRTKLEGERAVLTTLAQHGVVLRSAWLYAADGHNFLRTMLRLMSERGAVRVVADQIGTPTWARSVARALWQIVQRPELHGILHWTDAGTASWYDFAVAIAEGARAAQLLQREIVVTPITTPEYPTPARRPAYSVLDIRESAVLLHMKPTPWRESLRSVLAEMITARAAGARPV